MKCAKRAVLVLDRNFFPHRIIGWKRAMKLIYGGTGKAEVLQMYEDSCTEYDVSVIRLIHRSLPPAFKKYDRFSKKYLFIRDNYRCQYCGCNDRTKLTIDHVVPRSKGGATSYQNCVAACISCNNSKGNLSVEESGMILLNVPQIPIVGALSTFHSAPEEWKKFLT